MTFRLTCMISVILTTIFYNFYYGFTFFEKLLVSFILFGIFFNLLVIVSNKFKMPVYKYSYSRITDCNTHFHYKNKSDIKFYYLSDIFPFIIGKIFSNSVIVLIFSIGDMMIIFGVFLIIIGSVLW